MPVTLAQAALNTQDDLDRMIIDEFRKSSALLDALPFHDAVNPMGGGSTLTYGYHRVLAQRGAEFRAINSEYTPAEATKQRFDTDLKPLGGSFQIDRVLAQLARGAEVEFQLGQLIKATRTQFQDEAINGDTAVDSDGFDGLDKALTGTDTEFDGSAVDLTDTDSHGSLDEIDTFLSLLDGPPTMVLGNALALARFRAIARRANMYVQSPVQGLTSGAGAPVSRQQFGDVILVDPGNKAGSNDPIIPVTDGTTDIYAVRIGMDGFHGVSVAGQPLVQTWLPDFARAGAVKTGEVEMGPVGVALKSTKAAAVWRGVRIAAAA
jgi:hypothetical protein